MAPIESFPSNSPATFAPNENPEMSLPGAQKTVVSGNMSDDFVLHAQAEATEKLNQAYEASRSRASHPPNAAQPIATEKVLTNLDDILANQPYDIYSALALAQKTAQEMRTTNREIRSTEFGAQIDELTKSADDMQKAANYKLAASLVQSGTQIISGSIQLMGSLNSAAKAGQAVAPQNEATAMKAEAKDLNSVADKMAIKTEDMRSSAKFAPDAATNSDLLAKAGQRDHHMNVIRDKATAASNKAAAAQAQADGFTKDAEKSSSKAGGYAKATDILGGVAVSALNHKASTAEVSSRRHDARAKVHETAASQANEMMQQMLEVIRDIRDKLASIQQSHQQTVRGITQNF